MISRHRVKKPLERFQSSVRGANPHGGKPPGSDRFDRGATTHSPRSRLLTFSSSRSVVVGHGLRRTVHRPLLCRHRGSFLEFGIADSPEMEREPKSVTFG